MSTDTHTDRSTALDRFARSIAGADSAPLGVRRDTTSVGRRHDDRRPVGNADEDRPVLLVRATLLVAGQPVALVEETYLEAVLTAAREQFEGRQRPAVG